MLVGGVGEAVVSGMWVSAGVGDAVKAKGVGGGGGGPPLSSKKRNVGLRSHPSGHVASDVCSWRQMPASQEERAFLCPTMKKRQPRMAAHASAQRTAAA